SNPVSYSLGTSSSTSGSCYRWPVSSTNDLWSWTTPGRNDELASIDQKGYVLLDDNKQPLNVANNRAYFTLSDGEYNLDVIALNENLKLDAVAVNKVENFEVESRLAFQPDRREVDEKHIADYKRRILSYDISSQLKLPEGKKAYFEIEVKKQFNDQN